MAREGINGEAGKAIKGEAKEGVTGVMIPNKEERIKRKKWWINTEEERGRKEMTRKITASAKKE